MKSPKLTVGWREWIRLPDLGMRPILAKIDTGARTSALHAERIRVSRRGGKPVVHFDVPSGTVGGSGTSRLKADLFDERRVRSSNGAMELRPVIRTQLELGGELWRIEITLTSRHEMDLPMLLGRRALSGRVMVDPSRTCLSGSSARRRKARKSRR